MAERAARFGQGALLLLALAQTDCGFIGLGAEIGAYVSCPELAGSVDPFTVEFTKRADWNADVAAFVGAARDLMEVATEAEREALDACLRMGHDLGLRDADMPAKEGVSGRMAGACEAVAKKITSIVRGGVSLELRVSAPECRIDAGAETACTSRCAVGGKAPSAECAASCKGRAKLKASCDMPRVSVEGRGGAGAGPLVATLQANLPHLVHAELGLAKRALDDIQVLVDVGEKLPDILEKAGSKAVACVTASTALTTVAAVTLGVTVDASVSVSSSAGGKR